MPPPGVVVDLVRVRGLQAQGSHGLGELLVGERELHGEGAELLLLALLQVCVSVHCDTSFWCWGQAGFRQITRHVSSPASVMVSWSASGQYQQAS